jgi:hypothetical protein
MKISIEMNGIIRVHSGDEVAIGSTLKIGMIIFITEDERDEADQRFSKEMQRAIRRQVWRENRCGVVFVTGKIFGWIEDLRECFQ